MADLAIKKKYGVMNHIIAKTKIVFNGYLDPIQIFET